MKDLNKLETELEFLQQANDLMWAHIATMSHEVRTPATLLIGLSEYMLKQDTDTLTEKQLQHLESIHKNSRGLLETFEYFHAISRITLSSQEYELEEVDLEELCEETRLIIGEQNETQIIPHVLSNKYLLKFILEIITSLPYAEIEHETSSKISQNETHVMLYITVKYTRGLVFGKNDPRLRSCQIGIGNIGGQLSWEEPEDGKLVIKVALPIFQQDRLSDEEKTT